MIGVLEHLTEPYKILSHLKKVKFNIFTFRYHFFHFQLYENSFPNVFPRQLSGGHTHLYTKNL